MRFGFAVMFEKVNVLPVDRVISLKICSDSIRSSGEKKCSPMEDQKQNKTKQNIRLVHVGAMDISEGNITLVIIIQVLFCNGFCCFCVKRFLQSPEIPFVRGNLFRTVVDRGCLERTWQGLHLSAIPFRAFLFPPFVSFLQLIVVLQVESFLLQIDLWYLAR